MTLKRIGFIGGGNMARSLIGGLVAAGTPPDIVKASDPEKTIRASLASDFGIQTTTDNSDVVTASDVIVLAVKPQVVEEVLTPLIGLFDAHKPLVISVAAMPFEAQMERQKIAEDTLPRLSKVSHVCVELSLDRMAWQARERGVDWQQGSAWVGELAEGLMRTLANVGLINLDLMDLRAIVSKSGGSTLLVAEGHCDEAQELYLRARSSPLAAMSVGGATGCLLQVEGGPHMTLKQVEAVADAFTDGLSIDAQVILGARVSPDLEERMRVVAVVSGLPRGALDGLI